ncbi:hypothetical protein OUZ56_021219 [Daphnia magna]|uniref:ubiquitinyl hydrolase 1 n=1 Tax=Daphnia magna TaxID=35525 RepID=A0ABQ9ZGS3_9CRUS|nr:hypothetical protein OUZ56_021219 [Daphnia magna]
MIVAMNGQFAPALVSFCRRIQLSPYLNRFGSVWDVDVQGHIRALKDKCCKNSEFLANQGTGNNSFTRCQLALSLLARNAVAHGKRQQVLAKWRVFMNSWMYVLRKIGKYEHADQLERIFDFINNVPEHFDSQVLCCSYWNIFTYLWTDSEQVSLSHLSPWLGGGDATSSEPSTPSTNNNTPQSSVPAQDHQTYFTCEADAGKQDYEVMATAWRERNPASRVSAAKEALILNPECAPALLLLAEKDASITISEAEQLLKQALKAAEASYRKSQQNQHQGSLAEGLHHVLPGFVVELFHGQLKSKVTCGVCQRESVRFDPFNYLSLPLPLESYVHVEVVVLRLDGSLPVKYGLRLPMDATYLLLKERLASLCQISPDHLLFAEVSGAMIKTFPGVNSKVRPTSGLALFAYQVLSSTEVIQLLPANGGNIGAPDSGAKDANRNNNKIGHHSNNQIAKVVDKGGDTTATTTSSENGTSPGQESLPQRSTAIQQPVTNGGTNDERNGDRSSLASTSSGSGGLGSPIRQDLYFVSPHKTRPSLFGLPLLVPLAWRTDGVPSSGDERNRMLVLQTTSQDLYRDDSLGYEFPFTLKVVQANGIHCGICPWTKFCKGCPLAPTPDPLPNGSETNSSYIEGVLNYCIAVDWEPTALHLRYQTSLEKIHAHQVFDEDPSVAKALHQQTEPVSLEQCLQAFTREEQLSGDEKYYCPKCATHQPATKKLQIWRLPPILIVHLKRFQFVNHRWIKSHKAVQFPHNNLDFTEFLAAIPSETLVRHRQIASSSSMPPNGVAESSKDDSNDISTKHSISSSVPYSNGHPPNIREVITGNESTRKRLESTSLITHPVHDEDLIDFHQHRLLPGYNKLDITYSLYAAVCHSGIMGGGHYISYAKNPNGKWFYYNDSTCKESSANQIEGQTAYMLFFERDGIDMKAYLPKLREPSTSSAESANSESTSGKVAVAVSGLEEEEGKKCCIM